MRPFTRPFVPSVGDVIGAPVREWSEPTEVPTRIVTPRDGHYMTTFFDVAPLSPSGRFLVVTRVPFIWRIPYPGDQAAVCVIDLAAETCTTVYLTSGWGAQLGANAQWGSDDDTVYCNDVRDGVPVGVQIDLKTLEARFLEGTIFGMTPDRDRSYSPDLRRINAGIPGYGVPEGLFRKVRALERTSRSDGIWATDLPSGDRRLLLSTNDLVAALPDQVEFDGGSYYVFNVKVSPVIDRLFAIIFTRGAPKQVGWPPQLVTCALDGSDIRLAMPHRLWQRGGNHPNWAPDGEHIVMNLTNEQGRMEFVRLRHDGTDLTVLAPGRRGSGHPSLDPSQRFLLTDTYVYEGFTREDGRVPLRLIDIETADETILTWVNTMRLNGPRRIDPHPVWTANGKSVVFNCVIDGMRQVAVADLTSFTGS